ncbi:endonuclease/exonuclease/phosphatase family protein [Aeromicrobium wangtongii]|uniref:Endonuclease/exonuclease/phosphatase family protein n=1 Tax=Aeromicrobium wangtongii TaxID=2969247 RepID=A0ABY5M9N0_9ACTN|nr:endonuclease/exonuclease/phosphatase family protein [Aeromicrobium wangtongii]MCD9200108.1 endonuclease/exonuclease/phosphatase family protein [Aeromicrobium wangtongii]UUP13363.1 endonuclease/exonuclease/phosphatase family protein [Aeromicrobium wangtongii]
MPLRKLLIAALGSLLLTVGLAAPASARPARVAAPYVTAASPHTLTVEWPQVRGARRYTVHVAATPKKASRTTKRSHWSHGKKTRLKIKNLSSKRRYCFTVKAVRGGTSGKRSEPVCAHTLRRTIKPGGHRVSVATFNVCAAADNCKRWTKKRENAIVQRIVDARADVVAIQEITRKADKLASRLAKHGYTRYAAPTRKVDEAIYYRTAVADMAVTTEPEQVCEVEPYAGAEDTAAWRFPRHYDAASQRWYAFRTSSWTTEEPVCRERNAPVEHEGRIGSPTGASAAWAALRLKRTGQTYVFVSAHLSHGRTAKDGRLRGRETKQLIRNAERIAGPLPIIFMGDFNSYRGGPAGDAPRKEMARAGWIDTFDASDTYTRPYVSSFNGWRPKVSTMKHWGGHIDRIFIRPSMGSTSWRVVAKTKKRRYVGVQASDHNAVRTTILLP